MLNLNFSVINLPSFIQKLCVYNFSQDLSHISSSRFIIPCRRQSLLKACILCAYCYPCHIFILSFIHSVNFAFCFIFMLLNLHFVAIVICYVCIFFHLIFLPFAFCYICFLMYLLSFQFLCGISLGIS